MLEQCFEHAWQNYHRQSKPQQDALAINKAALQENQGHIDNLIDTISSGQAAGALFEMLNSRANDLKMERERLLAEQRRILETLTPLPSDIDAEVFRQQLISFAEIVGKRRKNQP